MLLFRQKFFLDFFSTDFQTSKKTSKKGGLKCAPYTTPTSLEHIYIVTCQAHPVFSKKQVKCTVRFFLKFLIGSYG